MVLSQALFRYRSSSFTATQMLPCNAQLREALGFSRLQMLEQVVRGEEAENKDLEEKLNTGRSLQMSRGCS